MGDMVKVKALAFDVFGTVTDWRTSISRECARIAGPEYSKIDWHSFAEEWRRGYKPAIDKVRSRAGAWEKVDNLHADILEELIREFGLGKISAAQKKAMNRVWHKLDPWPDAKEGLERLRNKFITCTLSNGNFSLLVDLARHVNLRFDCILSAELIKKYKTDTEAYLLAADLLEIPPGEIALVSAHPEDLEGAAKAGLKTVFVARPLEWRIPPAISGGSKDYDIIATDFLDLADKLT
jgi:2-haloacid dehalogenase